MKVKDWNKLEELGFVYVNNNKWRKKWNYYIKKESCKYCNEPFLTSKDSLFCSSRCSTSYRWKDKNSKFNSKETKDKISKSVKKLWENNDYKNNQKKSFKNRPKILGKNHYNWKGGYYSKGIPTYNTYAPQIKWCEEVRRNNKDPNVLEVKCFKCGEWFIPTLSNVRHKIEFINNKRKSSNNFYCSEQCKNSCSIYKKSIEQIMKEDAIRSGRLKWLELTREVQPELRQMVLERDNQCVKCKSTNDLQCHHILPVNIEPLLSADMDNCITLCKECHNEVHLKDGCKYNQLHIKEC